MTALVPAILAAGESFHGPSIDDFLPPSIWGPFNRINLIQIIAGATLVIIFMLYAKRAKLVPGRAQFALESIFDFVYRDICEEAIGKTEGRKYAPIVTTIFCTLIVMNITGIIPGMNIAGSSRIAVPIVLAAVSYVTFIVAGIKQRGFFRFFREQLFTPGVPKVMYILLAPIELFSTFIVRPVTLVIRLLANMVAGHLLLALCLVGTEALLIQMHGWGFHLIGGATFLLAIFTTLFEIFVAVLQAYVFAILTAVYINLSVHSH